ncbi:virulence factor esxA [Staphylococcus aureus F82568]|nr:virulence factor esxA [Staphylococcus aureus F82568]
MAMIKMSPEEIRAKSQSYGQGSDQIRQILSDLTRAQGEIAANWEGQAFSRFEEQFQQLSPKVEKFAQLLEEIKQQLKALLMPFKNKTNNFLIISVCNKHSEIGKVTFSNVALLIIFLRKQLKGNKHEKEKLDLCINCHFNYYNCHS